MPRAQIDDTHNPNLRSWVESANDPATDFPIQNLPFCVFDSFRGSGLGLGELGIRIGDRVLNIPEAIKLGLLARALPRDPTIQFLAEFDGSSQTGGTVLPAIAMEPGASIASLRRAAQVVLTDGFEGISEGDETSRRVAPRMEEVRIRLPVRSFNYSDFYASIHHATRVGSMFRPDNPLLPNYKWVPIGYHGRASSIVPSGTTIVRPSGQTKADDADSPRFGPCKLLDYELEVGAVVARGNELGSPIPLSEAEDHILGLCLVNDWSARDLQKWEYQPLGPFLAKSFATTVSPYIVTMEALAPFRVPVYKRPDGDPRPLPYLLTDDNEAHGAVDITLEVHIASAEMRRRSMAPMRISTGPFREMYWTVAQMLTHHASNGCNLLPGDLLASGTVSGPTPDSAGCLLELTWDGPGKPRKPIELPTGEKRLFLEDGDEVILRGYCERSGFRRIGFGECRGTIAPAKNG